MSIETFSKSPKPRWKKDLLSFSIIFSLTISTIIYYFSVQQNLLNEVLENFDLEYSSSADSSDFGIDGSRYITKDMKLKFKCNVPHDTEKVWIKLDNKTDWIQIPIVDCFTLTAKNNLDFNNYTLSLRCDDCIAEFTTRTYEPDLPIISISHSTEITNKELRCTVFIDPISSDQNDYSWANRELDARIRKRDSNNSYALELYRNERLLNMRYDDDWLLLPSKEYASALRTKLAFDIYNSLTTINPLCKISDAEPVDLFINDQYIGLYLLTERVDRKMHNLERNLPEAVEEQNLMFKAEDWMGDFYQDNSASTNTWEQLYPNNNDYTNYPSILENFIQQSSDEEFFDTSNGIFSKINRTQIIDYFLFGLLVGHNNLEGFKHYLVRNREFGTQYYFIPWDFDMSWGYSSSYNYSLNHWIYEKANNIGYIQLNQLLYRLLFPEVQSFNTQFITDMKNQWSELRNTIWKTEELIEKFNDSFNLMHAGLKRNNKDDPIDTIYKNILNWIIQRTEIIDNIDYNPFSIEPISSESIPEGIRGLNFSNSRYLKWDCILPHDTVKAQYKINGTFDWKELISPMNFSLRCSKELKEGYYNFSVRYSNNMIDWTGQYSFITRIIPISLPSLYIERFGPLNKNYYVNATCEIYHRDSLKRCNILESRIKVRGVTTYKLPKKGYRLELLKNRALLGMRSDDDWYLFASYMDFTRLRYKLSFDLWRSLLEKNPTAILPKSEYVNLYIDGLYQGIYLLAEKVDKKLFGLDDWQRKTDSSLVFNNKKGDIGDFYKKTQWEQEWPNIEDTNIIDTILPDLFDFINNTPDSTFYNPSWGIYSKFDKQNLIDFFVFNFFISHDDFWYKNYFVVRNTKPAKFFLCPWDFDGSFGQWGWQLNFKIGGVASAREGSVLFNRLLNSVEFKQDCVNRWIELRNEIWTGEYILGMLTSQYGKIREFLEIEMYDLWKPITVAEEPECRYPDWFVYSTKEFNLDEYVEWLYDYIPERLTWIDSYFANSFFND